MNFRCQHLQNCKNGNENFVEAKGAFVGTEYEKGTLPRLLFVSLDPGRSDSSPDGRTLEYVRRKEEQECDINKLPKSQHWYLTHALALTLLLVTQGKNAKKAIQQSYKITESLEDNICAHTWIFIGGKKVFWLPTSHPRNYGRFYKQKRECFDNWAEIIHKKFHKDR